MANTMNITKETSIAQEKEQLEQNQEPQIAEIVFGITLTVTTLYTVWCIVSFLLSLYAMK